MEKLYPLFFTFTCVYMPLAYSALHDYYLYPLVGNTLLNIEHCSIFPKITPYELASYEERHAFYQNASRLGELSRVEKFMPFWKPWPEPSASEQEQTLCPAWRKRLNPPERPHSWGEKYAWENEEEEEKIAHCNQEEKVAIAVSAPTDKKKVVKVPKPAKPIQQSPYSSYTCIHCQKPGCSQAKLALHLLRKHSEHFPKDNDAMQYNLPYECTQCNTRFRSNTAHTSHTTGCGGLVQLNGQVREAAHQYAQQMIDKVPPIYYHCSNCQEKFDSVKRLGHHIIQYHWSRGEILPSNNAERCDKPYECLKCKQRFSRLSAANIHIKNTCRSGTAPIRKAIFLQARQVAQEMNPKIR